MNKNIEHQELKRLVKIRPLDEAIKSALADYQIIYAKTYN